MKKNVVLVNFYHPIEHVYSRPLLPLSCLYLAGYLKSKGGYAPVIQTIDNVEEIDEAVAKALALDPVIVGISATFGLYTAGYMDYSEKIKKADATIPVVWGGVHASAVADLAMKSEYVDFVATGEGEIALYELAEALNGKREFDTVRNLVYRKNGLVVANNEVPIIEKDMDLFPLDFDLLDNCEKYVQMIGKDRVFQALTASRGCPHRCAFCFNHLFNRSVWREHSIERILSDVMALKEKVEFNRIRFVDDNFFTRRGRAEQIIARLGEIGLSLYLPNIRSDDIDDDMLKFFSLHGVESIFVGMESDSDRVLKAMSKGFSRKTLLEKLQIIENNPGVSVHTIFILGIPTHSEKEILDTIKFAVYWQKRIPHLHITLATYLPFPGTRMYHRAVCDGYPPADDVSYYIDCYVSSETGIFPGFAKLEWLNATDRFKRSLTEVTPLFAFYSRSLPKPGDGIGMIIIKTIFRGLTCLRLRFLYAKGWRFDLKAFNTTVRLWQFLQAKGRAIFRLLRIRF